MSGGSYDYAYTKLGDFIDEFSRRRHGRPLRQAFLEHLLIVQKAMKAIEWNDSGDGDPREREYIEACVGKQAEKVEALAQLNDAIKVAQDVIERHG
jgi:hypothetical protein